MITRFISVLALSMCVAFYACAQDEEGEKDSSLVLKTVNGVQFLVEPDREIENDPVTGILIPEPIDRYVARKIRALKEESAADISGLEEKIAALEKKIEGLEKALQRPLLEPLSEEPELEAF